MSRKVSPRAERVWKRLAEWYGARLADQYGPTPPPDWQAVINGADEDRLEQGLIAVRRMSPAYPPTLGQLESAIPPKRAKSEKSIPQMLADHVVETRGHQLCVHQLSKPWNYFGPMQEFVSKHRGNEVITHPAIRGVQVPGCEPCERPTYRVLLEQVLTP